MTAVSPATRALVLERDGHSCVSCGMSIRGPLGYSLHHRTPRGMGGTSLAAANSPANLVTLHGSGTTGCHSWAESHRTEARVWGYLVPRIDEPAEVPVLTWLGWVQYDHDGGYAYVYFTAPGPDGADMYPDSVIRAARDTRTGDRA